MSSQTLPPPEGPEYTPCGCSHIEPEHEPDAGACLSCDCEAYRPAGRTAVVQSAPAEAALRDRIRRAVCEAEGFAWDSDMLEPDEYGDHADAVLAALFGPIPAGTDVATWTAIRAIQLMNEAGQQRDDAVPADRAAALNEAARTIAADAALRETEGEYALAEYGYELARLIRPKELRRMADETQPAEARPSLTEWVVETLWRDGDWRSYYPARNTRDEAHREYENAVRRDADHAYRLTCATTAYAVEAEHQPAAGAPQDPTQDSAAETVHGCPPDGSGLTPCCGRTPFELPLSDRISSEAPVTCPGPAAGAQQPKETSNPRTVCVCGHTKGEHLTVSGRLLCDACDPDSTDNLVCRGFDAL